MEPVLYLNGDGIGIVNNCCFPSAVAPSYAPSGSVSESVVVMQNSIPTRAKHLHLCPISDPLLCSTD
jgi:hypothetical protein